MARVAVIVILFSLLLAGCAGNVTTTSTASHESPEFPGVFLRVTAEPSDDGARVHAIAENLGTKIYIKDGTDGNGCQPAFRWKATDSQGNVVWAGPEAVCELFARNEFGRGAADEIDLAWDTAGLRGNYELEMQFMLAKGPIDNPGEFGPITTTIGVAIN